MSSSIALFTESGDVALPRSEARCFSKMAPVRGLVVMTEKFSAVGYFARVIARVCPNKSLEIMTKSYQYSFGLL